MGILSVPEMVPNLHEIDITGAKRLLILENLQIKLYGEDLYVAVLPWLGPVLLGGPFQKRLGAERPPCNLQQMVARTLSVWVDDII